MCIRDSLDGGLRGHIHKNRRLHGAVAGGEHAAPCGTLCLNHFKHAVSPLSNEHGIAKAEKAIARLNCLLIGVQHLSLIHI